MFPCFLVILLVNGGASRVSGGDLQETRNIVSYLIHAARVCAYINGRRFVGPDGHVVPRGVCRVMAVADQGHLAVVQYLRRCLSSYIVQVVLQS